MGLNIVARRKLSLEGFAIGWEECFLIVRAVGEERANEVSRAVEEARTNNDTAQLNEVLRQFCLDQIESGRVINTHDDGEQEPYDFSKEEVAAVVDSLNFAWQLEVVAKATGTDRLK